MWDLSWRASKNIASTRAIAAGLAGRAAPKDKAVLLEIAEAWEQCAKDAAAKGEKTTDGEMDFRGGRTAI
jgi:hypothetical protein